MTHFHWDFIWSARFVRLLHISSSPVDWFVSSLLKPIINGQPLVKQKEEEQSVGSLKKKKNSSHSHTWIMEKKRNIWPQVSRKQIHYKPRKRKPARGGTQQMFIRGGPTVQVCCRPEVQPLTLIFYVPFFTKTFPKKVPLSYTFYWQMVPLSHTLFWTLHPF